MYTTFSQIETYVFREKIHTIFLSARSGVKRLMLLILLSYVTGDSAARLPRRQSYLLTITHPNLYPAPLRFLMLRRAQRRGPLEARCNINIPSGQCRDSHYLSTVLYYNGNINARKDGLYNETKSRCQQISPTCGRWQSCTSMGTYQYTHARTLIGWCSDKCARRGEYILCFETGMSVHQQIQEYKIRART